MAKRLLIVDDEPNLLRAVSLLLTHSALNNGGEQWVKVGIVGVFAFRLSVCISATVQTTAGTLTGTVVDPNNAAVAGADVTASDNATNKSRTVKTTDQGTFAIPQPEFGTYTETIRASGFKTYTAQQLKIDVGKDYSLNVQVEPGGHQLAELRPREHDLRSAHHSVCGAVRVLVAVLVFATC